MNNWYNQRAIGYRHNRDKSDHGGATGMRGCVVPKSSAGPTAGDTSTSNCFPSRYRAFEGSYKISIWGEYHRREDKHTEGISNLQRILPDPGSRFCYRPSCMSRLMDE